MNPQVSLLAIANLGFARVVPFAAGSFGQRCDHDSLNSDRKALQFGACMSGLGASPVVNSMKY
jgi:hypothetical protein